MKADTFAPLAVVGALALCCLGPVLASVFVALGVSAWFAQAGFVWAPALLLIAAAVVYAMRRRPRAADCCAAEGTEIKPEVGIQQ